MAVTGVVDGVPMKSGVAVIDVMTGKDAAVAILAALVGRASPTRLTRRLEISLMGTATAALVNVAQNVLVSGADATRWGNAHANLVPYQLFDAADRPLVIAVGSDGQWHAAAHALGLTALAEAPDLATNAGRLARREEVVAAIAARVATAPASHWMERLSAAGVPTGMVRSVREALADVEASAEWGVAPATGGEVRYAPPVMDAHGELVRKFHWSAFDHVPILSHRAM
jgi:crotonobetainyl-CoA:carnitine CoA-transferase CaiB-like acyl-CoA transferase